MGSKNYDNAIFDVDGTLFDTARGIMRCLKAAFDRLSLPCPSDETLTRFIGPSLRYSFTRIAGLDEQTAEEAIAAYRAEYVKGGLYECDFYDGVPELLAALGAAGVSMSVASSKPLPSVEKLLKHFRVYDCFERISAASFDVKTNEKADLIRRARTGGRAVMVGDRRFDIEGAREAGVDSIGVRYGFAPPGELEEIRPDFVAENTRQIQNIILGSTEL